METKHLYSFPAAGSLKEKRMCGFAAFDDAKHTEAANAAVEEATKLDEKADDVSKGNDALKKIDDAHKKIKEIRDALPSASVDEIPAMNEAVRKLEPRVRGARETFERKMVKIVEAHGKEAVKKIKASPHVALAPDPEIAIQEGFKKANEQTEPNVALLNAYATAIRDINAAKVLLMTTATPPAPVYPGAAAIAKGVLPGAIDTKQDDREKAIAEDKRIKENPGSTRKGGIPETDAASEDYRKALEAEIATAKAIIKDPRKNATEKVQATDQLKDATDRLTALENAERVRKGTTAPSAGPSTKPDEIKDKYKTEIKAIKDADGKSADVMGDALKAVNKPSISEDDRKGIVSELQKETFKTYEVSYDPKEKKVTALPKTDPAGVDVREGHIIKNLVEKIVEFLRNIGLLPPDMAGEKLTTGKIDDKIAKLKSEVEELKKDPTKKDIVAAKERQIRSLEQAKPIVVEAGKIGVDVEVEVDGRISFAGPKDKLMKMQVFLGKHNIKSQIRDGKLYLERISADVNGNLPPAEVKLLTDALKAIAQLIVGYRPGFGYQYMPTHPGYYGPGGYYPGIGAGAGFDGFGNPIAFAGMSGKGASRQRA